MVGVLYIKKNISITPPSPRRFAPDSKHIAALTVATAAITDSPPKAESQRDAAPHVRRERSTDVEKVRSCLPIAL